MSFNTRLSEIFERMSELLELTGGDRFRVAAHAKAARIIGDLTTDLEPIAHDAKALITIEGIGKGTAGKIAEFADTGKVSEFEELAAAVPAGLVEVLRVPGLGPKTVKVMWEQAGVTDLEGLRRIIEDGRILELPRMGAKTVENIRASLAFMSTAGGRLHLGIALPIARMIVERMRGVKGVSEVAYAGSLRRGRETIGDIDILVTTKDPAGAVEAFCAMPGVQQVLAAGESKSSVRMAIPDELGGRFGGSDEQTAIQVDLRVIPAASWGAAMMYFTGSKEHNIRLRERAQQRGQTLNEYGLFPDDGEPAPQHRGVKAVASKTEEAVYRALEVAWVPPTIREDRGELDLGETPELVELEDIKSELHSHTTASDGVLSIEDSARIAKERGFHTLAITDHSKSSAVANGLSEERLRAHIAAVRGVKVPGISILTGSEVDILADGALDYPDDLLAELDVVVASPHAGLTQDPKKATARLIRAIEHPMVHIIGHPTGRLIERRRGLEPAMDEVIAAAVEHGVALEINAHWLRLDLRDTHARAAVEAGCLIAINCDVHHAQDYDNLIYGVLTGQRGWLTKDLCINAWSKAKLHGWLKKGHGLPPPR